jgi:hypothetical protein
MQVKGGLQRVGLKQELLVVVFLGCLAVDDELG